jgi:hypothetical protein
MPRTEKILVMDLEETESRNDCAGEGQRHLTGPPSVKNLVLGRRWVLTPKLTGRLTTGRNLTLILTLKNRQA